MKYSIKEKIQVTLKLKTRLDILLERVQKRCLHKNIKEPKKKNPMGKYQCCNCQKFFEDFPHKDYQDVPHPNFL